MQILFSISSNAIQKPVIKLFNSLLLFMMMPACHKVITKTSERKTSCEWRISEASLRGMKPGKLIKTPFFVVDGVSGGKWAIEIYPDGYNASSRGYFSIFLHCKTNVELFSKLHFKIAGSKYHLEAKCTFSPYNAYYGFATFIKRCDIFNLQCGHLKKKELKLICEFEYAILRKPIAQVLAVKPATKSDDLQLDQCLLKDSQNLSDCMLIVEGKEIKAHKLILYLRSPVFQRMFETPMLEGIGSCVIITDFSYKVAQMAIEFCYTGKLCTDYHGEYINLLKFADKYDISTLKLYIEQDLSSKITIENVCSYVMVADFSNAAQLRQSCIDFMIFNLDFCSSFTEFSSLDHGIIKEIFNGEK